MRWLFLVFLSCGPTSGPDPKLCATRSTWTGGDEESPKMHPGGECISCHTTKGDGPIYTIAGTVFPTMRELTDCNGTNAKGTLSVEITASDGKVFKLPVNDVGNFFTRDAIAFPFRARVVSTNGKSLSMTDAQATGDCNLCHTSEGAHGAPGRILEPQ